jgi:D-alanyl-D-alanine dipeptidase
VALARAGPLAAFGALVLVAAACVALRPPRDPEATRTPDLVDLHRLDPTLRIDLRYATRDNFVGRAVYPPHARALLQRPAAEALARANARLAERGLVLVVLDAYRPWSVTKLFWDLTPRADREFVADPKQGSRHNRGCAVDLTLADRATGRELPMPSAYDEFTERAHPAYPGGPEPERANRDLLRQTMESEGFTVYENEWWHFDWQGWREYPVLDLPVTGGRPD